MNSLVLKDYNYSEALYNYKCVLADAEENLQAHIYNYRVPH